MSLFPQFHSVFTFFSLQSLPPVPVVGVDTTPLLYISPHTGQPQSALQGCFHQTLDSSDLLLFVFYQSCHFLHFVPTCLSQQYCKLLYGHPVLPVQLHFFILKYLLSILLPLFSGHNCWYSLFQPWFLSLPRQMTLLLQLCSPQL